MNLVFLGPPGVGKGTQACLLRDRLGFFCIGTGLLLREIVSSGSALGKKVKDLLEVGSLVSDSCVLELVEDKLREVAMEDSVVFDGFPRTLAQAQLLDASLSTIGRSVDRVVLFDVSESGLLGRLSHRRLSESRNDDDASVQARRLLVYESQVGPICDYYRKSGLLVSVDATGDVDSVYGSLLCALGL